MRRFERFRQASGFTEKAEESQVNTLIYAMGDAADDILSSFGLTEAEKTQYGTVRAKFESHFVKRCNPIFERAKFNQRRQEEGESVDGFITALYVLAEHCGYGALYDEMVRDRIVVGLQDSALALKLQMDPELTLGKAVSSTRQSEAIKKQQAIVRGDTAKSSIDMVRTKPTQSTRDHVREPPRRMQPQGPSAGTSRSCHWCGSSPTHGHWQCPARDSVCHKCSKRGHFQSVCRSAGAIREVQTDMADSFLGTVGTSLSAAATGSTPWTISISVNHVPISFNIDIGADVTVLSEPLFKTLQGVTLEPSTRSLKGPSGCPLIVCGQFTGTLQYKE